MIRSEFIKKAKSKHGEKYDYSHVGESVNSREKIWIICLRHNRFQQRVDLHLAGADCPECANIRRLDVLKNADYGHDLLDTKKFIARAQAVHGGRYNYSQTEYTDWNSPLTVICPDHGKFFPYPQNHLEGIGCADCFHKGNRSDHDKWIERVTYIHSGRYGYEQAQYTTTRTEVLINCPEHGEFWQLASSHSRGFGCRKCSRSPQFKQYTIDAKDRYQKLKEEGKTKRGTLEQS